MIYNKFSSYKSPCINKLTGKRVVSENASIRSSYVRYKESTQKLVRWLVTTVSSLDPKNGDNSPPRKGTPGPLNHSKRKGGKSKKAATKKTAGNSVLDVIGNPVISIKNFTQYAALIAESGGVEVPEAVYSLFESVIQARRMVANFYKQLNITPDVEAKNESHLNFIRVLEEAFGILGGREWREKIPEQKEEASRNRRESTVTDAGEDNAIHLANRFAELEVESNDLDEGEEEVTENSKKANDWISHIVAPKPGKKKGKSEKAKPLSAYKISEDLSTREEVSFAVWCFFVDMNSVRQYLKAVWNQVRKDNIDLVTASVVTCAGVELVQQLENRLQLAFPQIKDYPSLMKALLVELPINKTRRILDLLDFCLFFPVHTLCGFRQRVLREDRTRGSSKIQEISDIAEACGLKGRLFQASVARADQISEQAEFLDQYLFKLIMAEEYADRTRPKDEPRLGMTAFHVNFDEFMSTGGVETRLVFGLQVLLDTRKFLRSKKGTHKLEFNYALKFIRSQQDNLKRDIERLTNGSGPRSLIGALQQFIAHTENWVTFGTFKPSGHLSDVRFPDIRKQFLSENPWHLGLVYAEVSTQLFAMATYHSTLILPPMLHLYNFLLHASTIIPGASSLTPIPLLELLCTAFEKHIFQGSRPIKSFSTRWAIASRRDITAYASDAGRRARGIGGGRHSPVSGYSAKQVEKMQLPTIMSTLHAVLADNYKLGGNAYSWLERNGRAESEGLAPAAEIAVQGSDYVLRNNTKKGKGKREKDFASSIAALAPATQLDKLCESLFASLNGTCPIARVDMIKVRELSGNLRNVVSAAVRRDFASGLEGRTPERLDNEDDRLGWALTESILELGERWTVHSRERVVRIIEDAVGAFKQVFEKVEMEDYFVRMPKSRVRGWRELEKLGGGA